MTWGVAIAKNMVQALGARVVDTAGDYKTAFPMIAKRQYDLILCDFNPGKGPQWSAVAS